MLWSIQMPSDPFPIKLPTGRLPVLYCKRWMVLDWSVHLVWILMLTRGASEPAREWGNTRLAGDLTIFCSACMAVRQHFRIHVYSNDGLQRWCPRNAIIFKFSSALNRCLDANFASRVTQIAWTMRSSTRPSRWTQPVPGMTSTFCCSIFARLCAGWEKPLQNFDTKSITASFHHQHGCFLAISYYLGWSASTCCCFNCK